MTYEDKVDEIDELLAKMRQKWTLDSISWMDYDDLSQNIRIHILKKWDQWEQHRPFKPWCRTVITNQIRNEIRNKYGSFARPCLRCPHNMGGESCSLNKSGLQESSCKEYAKWEKKRKPIYDVKIPVSIEDKVLSDTCDLHDEFDFEESSRALHEEVLKQLTNERHKLVYRMLYMDNLDEDSIADKMGFTADITKTGKRYKQLNNLKKKFVKIATEIIDTNDIIQ